MFWQGCDIKYNKKACGQNTLDKDNQKGGSTGGPETITIKEYADGGQYAVFVDNYSREVSMFTAGTKARCVTFEYDGLFRKIEA